MRNENASNSQTQNLLVIFTFHSHTNQFMIYQKILFYFHLQNIKYLSIISLPSYLGYYNSFVNFLFPPLLVFYLSTVNLAVKVTFLICKCNYPFAWKSFAGSLFLSKEKWKLLKLTTEWCLNLLQPYCPSGCSLTHQAHSHFRSCLLALQFICKSFPQIYTWLTLHPHYTYLHIILRVMKCCPFFKKKKLK